mmetsp:Transcript_31162/g.46459  ORF Transcript_31162/g.46459 Transcript_31162/m.46459 type:complete len:97 (+) Transcript_31162:119-409(+)
MDPAPIRSAGRRPRWELRDKLPSSLLCLHHRPRGPGKAGFQAGDQLRSGALSWRDSELPQSTVRECHQALRLSEDCLPGFRAALRKDHQVLLIQRA